ncbi:MAG: AraC family transcriptional regulator [Citrobacter freundii]|nr:MAG: AraC family transcriptional regulator [Citrobacter freundii]
MGIKLLKPFFPLLHVNYVKLDKKWNYTNVLSPYFRIYYIDDGEGYIMSSNETISLEPGYLYIVPSFTVCNLRCDTYMSQYFLHFFEESSEGMSLFQHNRKVLKVAAGNGDIANFKRLLEINPGRGINRSDNPRVYEKNDYLKSYQELNNLVSAPVFIETQGIIMQLLSRFMYSDEFISQTTYTIPPGIMEAISFIQMNLKELITVDLLAKRANLHPHYFSRLFYKHTGVRPVVYIQEKRIERAQYLIATTNQSFTSIAGETGFDNVYYFSKIFKKITGVTPGGYKKLNVV